MRAALLATSILSLAFALPAQAQETPAPPAEIVALAPVPVGRLTDAVRPLSYRLDLTVNPDLDRFSGQVEVDAVLKSPSRFVDLHGRELAMHNVVARVGGKSFTGGWTQIEDSGVARLTFAEALPAGPVTFAFAYDAPFQSGPAGMFRVKVADAWYSWTQLQSIDARGVFPGFDEPGFKTPFTVTLRTKPGQVAVSNAPEVSKTLEAGLEVHRFAPTLPLPTYLVAAMVGPFAMVEGEVAATPQRTKPLPLRIISPQPNGAKLAFALEGSKGIVTHLENYFADAFPYPKLDQITSPIMPGAMENAGADLYGDSIIVMDENAPTGQKRNFGMIVAHELAHQWFGDLVTAAWWDDIWLNESFANWMGYRIGHEWRPDLNIQSGAVQEGFAAMNTDALVVGRPIRQKIETNAQIDEAFDAITYGKGGHVVAMIAGFMGDAKFRDGVRNYMAAHRYSSATSTDFFAAMAEVSGDPRIVPAMQGFVDQQGVPLLTFERLAQGRYTVRQSRYAALGTTPPTTHWGIPLCVRRDEARECLLLDGDKAELTIPGSGVLMPNAGGTGYFRFELPRAEWDALIAVADRLPSAEALALSDSLLASFRAGRASATQLAELARKLSRNPDSYASGVADSGINAMMASGMLDNKAMKRARQFLASLSRPKLAQIGFDPKQLRREGESPEIAQQRRQLVGIMAGVGQDEALRKQLRDGLSAWLAGDKTALDPAYLGNALEATISVGGLATAQSLMNWGLSSQDPVFRPNVLGTIGGSGNPAIAKWLLNEFKDERLRSSERFGLVRGIIQSAPTRDLGYDWLRANFATMTKGSGGIFLTSGVAQALAGFCSVTRADEISREMRPFYSGKTGALSLERTIERVRNCGRLRDARGKQVSREIRKLK